MHGAFSCWCAPASGASEAAVPSLASSQRWAPALGVPTSAPRTWLTQRQRSGLRSAAASGARSAPTCGGKAGPGTMGWIQVVQDVFKMDCCCSRHSGAQQLCAHGSFASKAAMPARRGSRAPRRASPPSHPGAAGCCWPPLPTPRAAGARRSPRRRPPPPPLPPLPPHCCQRGRRRLLALLLAAAAAVPAAPAAAPAAPAGAQSPGSAPPPTWAPSSTWHPGSAAVSGAGCTRAQQADAAVSGARALHARHRKDSLADAARRLPHLSALRRVHNHAAARGRGRVGHVQVQAHCGWRQRRLR